jgi:hypothetical protein
MGLNLVLLVLGLLICFGGIYFRRLCSGILGLICGVLGAFAFVLITAGLWSIADDSSIITMIICGLVFAVISAIYYKACAVINSFLSSFALVSIFLAAAGNIDSEAGVIIIAAVIALIVAAISFKFYDYSFIITTALIGAFIASIGGFGLFHNCNIEDIIPEIVWNGFGDLTPILISTILLGILGFFIQLKRLRLIGSTNKGAEESKVFNSEQLNHVAATVTTQAKKAGQATAPVFQDVGSQAKEVWNDAKTPEGRAKLKDEIVNEKLLFIAPLIAFVIMPIIYRIINSTSIYYSFFTLLRWIGSFASAISLGTYIYFILRKNRRFVLFYTLVYTAGYLLVIIMNLSILRYSLWDTLVSLSEYLILWVILDFVSKKVRRENIKPILLLAMGLALDLYLIPWLAQVNIYFYFTFQTVLFIVITFATVYFLFKKRDGISIVALSGGQAASTQPTQYTQARNPSSSTNLSEQTQSEYSFRFCPNCGNKLTDAAVFCAACGKKIR